MEKIPRPSVLSQADHASPMSSCDKSNQVNTVEDEIQCPSPGQKSEQPNTPFPKSLVITISLSLAVFCMALVSDSVLNLHYDATRRGIGFSHHVLRIQRLLPPPSLASQNNSNPSGISGGTEVHTYLCSQPHRCYGRRYSPCGQRNGLFFSALEFFRSDHLCPGLPRPQLR